MLYTQKKPNTKVKTMHRQLLHLYGPLAINSFGLFIVIGIIIFSALFLSDPKRSKIISTQTYFNGLSLAIIAGLAGGRLLFVLSHPENIDHWLQIFAFWMGGFSLLGGVVALLIAIPLYLKKHKIEIIPLLDLTAVYAPLLQAISRIGCFFAGCCFGAPTTGAFGVYNTQCGIPELSNRLLHPTQLYSAAALLIIFLIMYFILEPFCKKKGQLACSYLLLMSLERFTIDFWRADRDLIPGFANLSIPQAVALILALIAFLGLITISFPAKKHKPS